LALSGLRVRTHCPFPPPVKAIQDPFQFQLVFSLDINEVDGKVVPAARQAVTGGKTRIASPIAPASGLSVQLPAEKVRIPREGAVEIYL